MNKYKKILSLALILALGLFLAGCESDDNTTDQNPLVGTWVLNNMEQTALYTVAVDLATLGLTAGDTLGGGTVDWATLSAMGVNATAELFEDGTYSLNGNVAQASDTLGFAPTLIPLSDQGVWEAADDLSTLLLNGAAQDFPPSGVAGPITVDDVNNPTTISMTYSEQESETVVLPVDVNGDGIPDMFVDDVPINAYSTTTLGFAAQ
ncbi:MAG: hypothetical protein GXO90_02860 [FCB group bacterium]|nr:hypothetical protein [FCB group bacterium]